MGAAQLVDNRFRIADLDADLLGRGGMGAVYRATDTLTGETVAVKALDPDVVACAPEILERFVREGEALRQLNHPSIVRLVTAVEEAGRHYLVMEYVPGGSLADLLRAVGRLPVERVVEIGLDLADALTRAHRLGILHRDIKPANVLLAADGTPRLADFGIARLGGDMHLTQAGAMMGTVDYLSPEACRGEPLDERSDIWSFGVLLFELLAGRVPFGGDTIFAQLNAILTQPLPDLAQLVPGLPAAGRQFADLLARMLDKDCQQRLASVRQVGLELEVMQKGWPPTTPSAALLPAGVAASRFGPATPTPSTGRRPVLHERRLVTILCCAAQAADYQDPEDVLEEIDAAFEIVRSAVHHYEGTLAPRLPNAVIALFGVPVAREDDPERAIHAGLEIIASARQYAAELEKEHGIRGFGVRVGIDTGQVVITEVGKVAPRGADIAGLRGVDAVDASGGAPDLWPKYTATGDAVGLAALMEQNAPPGGMLITHDTYRHVRGVFDVSPQQPLAVKGRSEQVQTYLVQRAKSRAFRVGQRGIEGIETRMVGREAELLALQNHFLDALAGDAGGETHVVTIVGETGVGKTRLLDEFLNWGELRPEQFYYFRGQAGPASQAMPYALWRDLFAYRFEILDSDPAGTALVKFRAGMAGLLEPEKADLVGQLVGLDLAAAGSEAVRALLGSPSFGQLARAYLVQYFRGLLAQGPAVMLLEDLHWADDSSVDLVAELAAGIPQMPLLIVATARPALLERRPNWGEGQGAYSRLELEPLSKRASRALVEDILRRAGAVPGELRELVVEAADGNPYYVEELIQMLIEDGVIVRGEPCWRIRLERLAEVRVPPTLTAVLQTRLDALPAEEKALLQRASVVGRQFWDGVVSELAGDADAEAAHDVEVGPLLAALRKRELVYQREQSAFAGTREYTFKHQILRDVTYETVLLRQRRRYHAQAARWLEAHAGERLGEYLGLIAGHWEEAGEREKAAEYLRRAAEEAHRTSAFRAARAALERALELLPRESAEERARVAVALGRALILLGDLAAARERLEEGLALARTAGARATEGAALTGLGEVAWRQGDRPTAYDRLLAGLALARECGDVPGQAWAAQHLAGVLNDGGQSDEAEHWARESQRGYAQAGDRQGVIEARNVLGVVADLRGDLEQAKSCFAANLAEAREMGDRFAAARALNNLGEVAKIRGEYEQARAHYEQGRVIWEEIGHRQGVALVLGNLGEVCIYQGQDSAAWDYLRQALRERLAMQAIPQALNALVNMSRLRLRAGQPEAAARLLGPALRHPASTTETERDARPVLEALREAIGAEALEAALARGAEMDLEEVVAEILTPAEA